MLVTARWHLVVDAAAPGELIRFTAEFAARTWPARPDREFATSVGVSHADGLFRPFTSLIEHDPAVPDDVVTECAEIPLPEDTPHGLLQQLGWMLTGRAYLNLDDGTIWHSDPDFGGGPERINSDLSSLAYVLYKAKAEAPVEALPGPDDYAGAEQIIREDTTRWDPVPFDDKNGFWSRYLDDYQLYV